MAHIRDYRPQFVEAHGEGPYVCFFCGDTLLTLEYVHHIDEDRENNDLSNLAASHAHCHNSHHHVGTKHSDETRARISASLRNAYESGRRPRPDLNGERNPFHGKQHSDETKKKISDAKKGVPTNRKPPGMTGKKHTDEAKRKMSEAAKSRWAKMKEDR